MGDKRAPSDARAGRLRVEGAIEDELKARCLLENAMVAMDNQEGNSGRLTYDVGGQRNFAQQLQAAVDVRWVVVL